MLFSGIRLNQTLLFVRARLCVRFLRQILGKTARDPEPNVVKCGRHFLSSAAAVAAVSSALGMALPAHICIFRTLHA
jgi:hypothetical protein